MPQSRASGRNGAHPSRGALRLLVDRRFGALFWGKLIATTGMWMHTIAAAIVIYDETRSAAAVGLVSIAQFAPQLLLTPLSGSFADRGRRARQIIIGRLICASGSAATGLAILVGDLEGTALVAVVVACSGVVGLGFVTGGPAMQSIVPDLVRPSELTPAMTLNSLPVTAGRIAGPVIGAYTVTHLGAEIAFLASGAMHLVMVVLLLWARIPATAELPTGNRSVRAGLAYVRSDRALWAALLITVGVGIGSEPTLTLAPALAHDLGGGSRLVGFLSLTLGCGTALGTITIGLVSRWLRPRTVARWGLVLLTAPGLVVWASDDVTVSLLSFGVAGIGLAWSMTGSSIALQERSEPQFRGRVMALWLVAFIGTRPVVAAGLGAIADATTVGIAFTVSSAGVFLMMGASFIGFSRRDSSTAARGVAARRWVQAVRLARRRRRNR